MQICETIWLENGAENKIKYQSVFCYVLGIFCMNTIRM